MDYGRDGICQDITGQEEMKAMLLRECAPLEKNPHPLEIADLPLPELNPGEALIRVSVCGVCHTELDEIEGRMNPPHLPVIPGHQVVGIIEDINNKTSQQIMKDTRLKSPSLNVGDRVGIAWINSACGRCEYCTAGFENLCVSFVATGRDVNGGYAQYIKAKKDFLHLIPSPLTNLEAAPLLCAGAIGFRSLELTGIQNGDLLGLAGFGSSGHLTLKIAKSKFPDTHIYVFSRNPDERQFALALGAAWAGTFDEEPPALLNGIIDTTPAWRPILTSLACLKPGGRLVINAIRKEELDKEVLAQLEYPMHIWKEKEIKSVANVTRRDVRECLSLAAEAGIRSELQVFGMEDANQALLEMKQGRIRGAKVLQITH